MPSWSPPRTRPPASRASSEPGARPTTGTRRWPRGHRFRPGEPEVMGSVFGTRCLGLGVAEPIASGSGPDLGLGVAEPIASGSGPDLGLGVAEPTASGSGPDLGLGVAEPTASGSGPGPGLGVAEPIASGLAGSGPAPRRPPGSRRGPAPPHPPP